jgi:hypothetical protein
MRQFPAARLGSVLLAGVLASWTVVGGSQAHADEPVEGSSAAAPAPAENVISIGDVGEWTIGEGFEVSRRSVDGPDGNVTMVQVERLDSMAQALPGSFVALSLYPEGITMEGATLDAAAALRLTVDSIAASTGEPGITADPSPCEVGGLGGVCAEFTVGTATGELQVDARAVVVGGSLVTTVLVVSSEAGAELATLLDGALRLEQP